MLDGARFCGMNLSLLSFFFVLFVTFVVNSLLYWLRPTAAL